MMSIYREALGPDFERLHPQIQKRFGFNSADGLAAIGTGVMEELWHGRFFTLPFLYVGTWRRIMFPERGHNVPFTIQNYAYRDRFGRETVTWIRNFQAHRPRRFDAYMIHSPQRGKIVDYLGTHQHLAVDIDLSVDERGGLRLHRENSGSMRALSRSDFRCSFPASPTCASGTTTQSASFALRSESPIDIGALCSATTARSTWNGGK